MVQNSIRDMQAQKVFARYKNTKFSCLASLYLLCSVQAIIQRQICYILIFSFLEKFVKGELVKSLFMIGICHYLWL